VKDVFVASCLEMSCYYSKWSFEK